jgi:hypothetical protein
MSYENEYESCDACYEDIYIHQSSHIMNVFETSPLKKMSTGYRLNTFAHVCDKCEVQHQFSDLFVNIFLDLVSEKIDLRKHSNSAANDPFYNEDARLHPESFLCTFCDGYIPSIEAMLVIWQHDIVWSQEPYLTSSMRESDIMRVRDLLTACAPCSQSLDLFEIAQEASVIALYILNYVDPSEEM